MTSPADRALPAAAGVLSAGAGLVHLGLAAEHAAHHWSMGAAFLALGWVQLAWAPALLRRPSRAVVLAGALLQAAALAGLVLVTLVGWPVGPLAGQPEALTAPALLTAALEVGALLAGLVVLRGAQVPRALLPVALAGTVAAASGALLLSAPTADQPDHHGVPVAAAAGAEPEVAGAHPEVAGAEPVAAPHGHGPVDTTPPTAAQRAAADSLLSRTRTALQRYQLASVAEAEGYTVVHDADGLLLHYAHKGHRTDGRTLDPSRIESLLYVVLPGGGKLLVGGMYMMPLGESGPRIGGSLTQWHAHDDLCLDPAQGIAITQLPGGGCPAGSFVGPTGEMMHVWSIEYPGGPFGELDAGHLRQAVRAHYGISADG